MDCDRKIYYEQDMEFLRIVSSGSKVMSKVTKLFKSKIDVNINFQDNENENSALHVAVGHGDRETIEYLIDIGVDVSLKNKEGKTAKQLAIYRNLSKSIINLFGEDENMETCLSENKIFHLDVSNSYIDKELTDASKQSDLAVIKLINCDSSRRALEILENDNFCSLVNSSLFLFIIDIEIDKFHESDFSYFYSKIDDKRPIIIQIKSKKTRNHIIHYREPFKCGSVWKSEASELITDDEYLVTANMFNIEILLTMLNSGLGGSFADDLLKCTLEKNAYFDSWRFIDYAAYYNDVLSLRLMFLFGDWDLSKRNDADITILEIAAEYSSSLTMSAILNLPLTGTDYVLSNEYRRLLETNDGMGKTPFIIALEKGKTETVELLIELGSENKNGIQSSVDLLWKLDGYDKLVVLLKKDAPFPSNFNLGFSHRALEDIVNERELLHNAIKTNDEYNVLEFIKYNRTIKMGYNKKNVVALQTALEAKNYRLYALLQSNGFLKDNTVIALLDNLSEGDKSIIQNEKQICFKEMDDGHILHLISRTKHASDIEKMVFVNRIKQLYEILDQIPRVSQVLKILKYSDSLDIVFDFDNDSIIDIDLTGTNQTKGSCHYKSGQIFIGGKRLSDNELLGTLAHEFTHLAMQIRYNNNCNPYDCFDKIKKTSFDELVKYFEKNMHCDEIIKMVFIAYRSSPDQWPSELIVRINHIVALYADRSSEQLEKAAELLEWYDSNIFADFESFLKNPLLFKSENDIQQLNEQIGLFNIIVELSEKIDLNNEMLLPSCIFDSNSITILVSEFSNLDFLNMYQVLLDTMTKSKISRTVIFLPSSDLLNYQTSEKIHRLNKSLVRPKIIIDCTSRDSVEHVISIINSLIFKDDIILLATKHQVPELADTLSIKSRTIFDYKIQYNFEYLSEKSKGFILDKTIVFQNVPLRLRDILSRDSPARHYLLLGKFFENKTLIVDELPVYPASYFMERTFACYDVMDEEFWKIESDDKFIFSEEEFNSLCQTNPEANIHFFEGGEFTRFWVKSTGSIAHLRKHMKYTLYNRSADLFFDIKTKKIALISDFPGMGKSAVIAELAKLVKIEKNNRWVSVIRLNEHTDTFYSFRDTKFKSAVQAVCFMGEMVLKLQSSFERELFKYSCMADESLVKVALFFDGIDEVSPTYYHLIVELISQLRRTAIEQIWVTTRPHLTKDLEDVFNIVHFRMNPFTREEQVTCLTNIWKNVKFSEKDGKIEFFSDKLIEKTFNSLKRDTEFSGTPLLLVLLAEAYKEDVQSFCEISDDVPWNLIVDVKIHRILQFLIDKKFKIYAEEKSKIPQSNIAAVERAERDRKGLLEAHRIFALNLLFADEEYFREKAQEAKREFNDEELSRIGLVTISGGNPVFIHRAFAEHFAAQFFVAQIAGNTSNSRFINILTEKILILDEFSVTRSFLDGLIETPFVTSILEKFEDIKLCKMILKIFVKEDSWNLAESLFLGLKSLNKKETIEKLLNITMSSESSTCFKILRFFYERGYDITIDNHFCYGWMNACLNEQMELLDLFKNIYIQGKGKYLNTIFEMGWLSAIRKKKITFLEALFLWIEEDATVGKALLVKETTWNAVAAASDDRILERLRCWNESYKLNRNELKIILLRKSMWVEAAKFKNLKMLRKLWEWCKEVKLEMKEYQSLLINVELWRIAVELLNSDLLHLFLEWVSEIGSEFKILRDFMISEAAESVNDEKWLETIWRLVLNFESDEKDFKVLFRAVCKSYQKNWSEFDFFHKLWLLAERLQISPDAFQDEIIINWRYACCLGNVHLLEILWKWMENSTYNRQEKLKILSDQFSWELTVIRNSFLVQQKLWQWSFKSGLTSVEFNGILIIIWRVLAVHGEFSQMKNLLQFCAQESPSCHLKLPNTELETHFIIKFKKKIKSVTKRYISDIAVNRDCKEVLELNLEWNALQPEKNEVRTFRISLPGEENPHLLHLLGDIIRQLVTDEETWENTAACCKFQVLQMLLQWLHIYSIDNKTKINLVHIALSTCESSASTFETIIKLFKNNGVSDQAIEDILANVWKQAMAEGSYRIIASLWAYTDRASGLHNFMRTTMTDVEVWREASQNGHHDLLRNVWKSIDNTKVFSNILKDDLVWSLAADNGHRWVLRQLRRWYTEADLEKERLNTLFINAWRRAAPLCKTHEEHEYVMKWFFRQCKSEEQLNDFFHVLETVGCNCMAKLPKY